VLGEHFSGTGDDLRIGIDLAGHRCHPDDLPERPEDNRVERCRCAHLIGVARVRGCRRVSLETWTMEAFTPARALYSSTGFAPCEPFGEYERTEDSYFMTLAPDAGLTSAEISALSATRRMWRGLPDTFMKTFFIAKILCTYAMNYLRQEISLRDHEGVLGYLSLYGAYVLLAAEVAAGGGVAGRGARGAGRAGGGVSRGRLGRRLGRGVRRRGPGRIRSLPFRRACETVPSRVPNSPGGSRRCS
jgi:hypothetical protein